MHSNYSEIWRHLKSILSGFTTTNRTRKVHSYTEHTQAKALSLFLAHATLATPKLNRENVEAALKGLSPWPHINGRNTPQFEGTDLSLSFLEENGFVDFYADWCTVHCQGIRSLEHVDPSIIPLLKAVEHLKNICYGRDGYIRPHYICPADKLSRLLATNFGNVSVSKILPALQLEDDHLKLLPGNQNFNSLVSTYLWYTLLEFLEPKQAFERWILCMRVNCNWAIPVQFDDLDYRERSEFNTQLLAYITKDIALNLSIASLYKQSINVERFESILTSPQPSIIDTISGKGNNSSEHPEMEPEKTTLATLNAAYQLSYKENSDNLQFVQQWQQYRYSQVSEIFYTELLASTIETSIHIDVMVLTSSKIAEALLELAISRPILRHLLFNVLSRCENASYMIMLLSKPTTCDVAFFYLTQKSFSTSNRDNYSLTQHLNKGYQQLVCHEYLRTIEGEPECGDRLLKVIEFLGERCSLHVNDFSKSFEYQFLLYLLDSLNHLHVIQLAQALTHSPTITNESKDNKLSQHYIYFLVFWLLERIENTGIDLTGALNSSLKKKFLNYYKIEFEESLIGHHRCLKPNVFFSALPWHKFIGQEDISSLLTLSNGCNDWRHRLDYSNNNNFSFASTIRHYLQVLMSIGRLQTIPKECERVAHRVCEIVLNLGFGPRKKGTYLFDSAFYSDQYDLWASFCSYTNLFQDSLYEDFLERCVPRIPLDQLFILLERCPIIVRVQKLQELIVSRSSLEIEDLGLSGLEQAFLSACRTDHSLLPTKLIGVAKDILAQERFARTNNPHIVSIRKLWLFYEYQCQLIALLDASKCHPDDFSKVVDQIQLPYDNHKEDDRGHKQECEHFRRYIIAEAYREKLPNEYLSIMEDLYEKSKSISYGFKLFKGRVDLYEVNKDTIGLRRILSQFLSSIDESEPMPTLWIATILDAYRQLHDDQKIDVFWRKLNSDQQARIEVLRPYCLALIARGDALNAQQIITRYRELNMQSSEGLAINELIDELLKAVPNPPMSELIKIVNEESQRSNIQLAKHYKQIVSKDFEDYVAIVDQGKQPHEFLKQVVLEVAEELLLRKKNLQLHSVTSSGKDNVKITHEDLINDWFTSLFDKRMAEARIGVRDQKRGGQSASGKNPGEIDGYITDAKNNRIALFEAFRLFSKDTTVISTHLDKINGYDNESLSPIFIVAYCDVSDFNALANSYNEFINCRASVSPTVNSVAGGMVEILDATDHIWLGMEHRHRSPKETIIYHLLLNMGSATSSLMH